jgi:hypothetical protein
MDNDMHITNAASDNVWNAVSEYLTEKPFNEMMEMCHRDGAYSMDHGDRIFTLTHMGCGKYSLDIEYGA